MNMEELIRDRDDLQSKVKAQSDALVAASKTLDLFASTAALPYERAKAIETLADISRLLTGQKA